MTIMRCTAPLMTCLLALVLGCNVDGLLLTELTRGHNRPMPDPAPQMLTGKVADGGGAAIAVLGPDGNSVGTLGATADGAGAFSVTLPGDVGLNNAVLRARVGRKEWMVLVPQLPAQKSVLDPARTFDLAAVSPGALQADDVTTAMTLLVVAKLRSVGQALAGASAVALTDTLIDLHQKIRAPDAPVELLQVVAMVARLRAQLPAVGQAATYDLAGAGSLLAAAALQSGPVDVDGDGQADATTGKFDAILAAALGAFSIKACYEPTKIRVVLQTRFAPAGGKDGNCDPTFNPYLWTEKSASKTVFVTGGIHKDTPRCEGAATATCLSQAQIDAASAALGNWVPNQVRMYDDGSHGDGAAGDGIWTVALDLPYIEPNSQVAPVRIAYKFTYGKPAQGWTDSEEFPGNQRLLELVDVNGDHIVTRFDLFADETGNKDKKNANQSGCGEVHWTADPKAGCTTDVRERKADLDGDCVIDGWPSPGSSGPLAIACPK